MTCDRHAGSSYITAWSHHLEAHLDSVEAAVTGFRTDHAREIEQAQVEWSKIEERAAELGFHGQVGSLD